MGSSLRELGMDLLEVGQRERALGAFAEAARRVPSDHRSRFLAARCLEAMGERERAVTALHACAEGLLRRDYLLSAMWAVKLAMQLSPRERRLRDTLGRVYARAVRATHGRATVPPLPPEVVYEGRVEEDLMTLSGSALVDRAMQVLGVPDAGDLGEPGERPPLPLFADLSLDAFMDLVDLMSAREVATDQVICRESESSDALFVMVAGKAEVSRRREASAATLGILTGGSIFGELSLLSGAPLTATVTAVAPSELFEIRREQLNQLAKLHPGMMDALVQFAHRRMTASLLSSSPLFRQLQQDERMELLKELRFRPLREGESILVEGEHSPGLFLLLAGELVVRKSDPQGGTVTLGTLREGDVAGEISLLTRRTATATVVATQKTACAFLPRDSFAELTVRYPAIVPFLEGLSQRRLQEISDALRPAEIIDADELVIEASNGA